MRAIVTLAVVPLLAILPQDLGGEGSDPQPETVTPVRQDFRDTIDFDGRFVPADYDEISIWPEAYGGGLLFLEVVPHGTFVNAGDVIARFDMEPIDDQIAGAERDLHSTELAHEATVVRAELAEEAAQVQLEDAVLSLERAQRSLEGWEKYELPFHHRSRELSRNRYQYGIDDQVDELKQLEAMYRDDELVDAVEEIVLSRSRRDLASARANQKLSIDRWNYEDEYETPENGKRRARAVKVQKGALDRLVRSQELDRKSRRDGIAKSEVALGKKREQLQDLRGDRERLVLRAPRSGVVLHGGAEDYEPGKQHAEYRRGSQGGFRKPLFCVASADRLAVALSVGESKLAKVHSGLPAEVRSLFAEDAKAVGTLDLARYPQASSGHGAEGSFAGRVAIEKKLPGVVAGMRAKVTLVCETIEGALLLPVAAVHRENDAAHCWVLTDGGGKRKVSLTLGPQDGDRVVVSGDLTEKTQVLLGAEDAK